MSSLLVQINKSITAKLVIAISILVSLCGFLFWFISINSEKTNSMHDAQIFTASMSELTKRSIRHDMMTAERNDIQQTMEAIGLSESIVRASIFDETGTIHYSSDTEEIGNAVTKVIEEQTRSLKSKLLILQREIHTTLMKEPGQ